MKTTGSEGLSCNRLATDGGADDGHGRAHFVADLAIALERLLEADERVEAVVVLADGDMGTGAGTTVDETLVLQRSERLTNGVAGDEELACQVLLARQSVGVAAGMDLVSQHVGNQARLVGARSAKRRRFCMMLWVVWLATVTSRGLFVV